ncbi:hypothetical protein OH77DRAFT_1422909 [Trametes cingulata]|nr:hypothetical protein OH77DRAFT_1422909 [Trametes cingulata]
MNSTSQAEITALIEDSEFDALQNYCTTAAAALFAYDFLVTFNQELTHLWRRKLTFARGLFLANRYVPLVTAFYVSPWWNLPTDSKVSPPRCAAVLYSQYILEFSQNGIWGAIACLRVYALRKQWATAVIPRAGNRVHRLWRTLPVILTLVFALVPVVVDMVLLAAFMWPDLDPVCSLATDVPTVLYENLTVISYASFVLSEAIAAFVTWIAANPDWHNAYAIAAPSLHLHLPVSVVQLPPTDKEASVLDVLQRDVLNVIQAVVDVLCVVQPTFAINQISALMTFVSPLRTILLTHFYFSLMEAESPSRALRSLLNPAAGVNGEIRHRVATATPRGGSCHG